MHCSPPSRAGTIKGCRSSCRTLARGAPLVLEIPPLAARLARAFWPRPLTIALPPAAGVDPRLTRDEMVAVRWPAASPAADLARALGRPLTATSANLPGAPPARTGAEVRASLRTPPDLPFFVVEGAAVDGVPSTVVSIEGRRCRIVRLGAIAEADLPRVLGAPCRD
ncbi:MAG TPA: Sua5/YciO/YrdC/YwlC family protein [Polyangiaceae bacterium]|mgnify:CR=1 FL=1|nr:Sua5/YciO/YrdC/YwlC family protein [Polyangiaceae bacterium]